MEDANDLAVVNPLGDEAPNKVTILEGGGRASDEVKH